MQRHTGTETRSAQVDTSINAATLASWVALGRQGSDGAGRLSEDERLELARLRRENAELAMERDVLIGLKRSVALWVKDATGRRCLWPGSSLPKGRTRACRVRWRVERWGSRRLVL